jgi:uncharacterized metal-binding protein
MADHVPENAVFFCFGAMANVGMMTGQEASKDEKQVEFGKAEVFCLGGVPTQAPGVLEQTSPVKMISTLEGCQLNCSREIVEQTGFTPAIAINLVKDSEIHKKPPLNSMSMR